MGSGGAAPEKDCVLEKRDLAEQRPVVRDDFDVDVDGGVAPTEEDRRRTARQVDRRGLPGRRSEAGEHGPDALGGGY